MSYQSGGAAPQPLITYEIPAPGIGSQLVYRLQPPNQTQWDVVRCYVVASKVANLIQADFNGSPGPPGVAGIVNAYGGLYKGVFDKSTEIALWSFLTQQKQFVELQQPVRIGFGESVLAVLTAEAGPAGGLVSGVVFGVQVLEYPSAL